MPCFPLTWNKYINKNYGECIVLQQAGGFVSKICSGCIETSGRRHCIWQKCTLERMVILVPPDLDLSCKEPGGRNTPCPYFTAEKTQVQRKNVVCTYFKAICTIETKIQVSSLGIMIFPLYYTSPIKRDHLFFRVFIFSERKCLTLSEKGICLKGRVAFL